MSPPDVGRGRKMPLARLGPVGGNVLVQLHFDGNETSLQEYNCLSLEIKDRKKASFPSRYNTAHRTSEIKLKSNEILLIASLSPGGSWALVKSPLVEVPWDHEGRQYLDIFFSL